MSNAELRAVKGGTVLGTAIAGANPRVAVVSRLVPHSGIQFIDLRLKTSALSVTVGKLIEEADAEDGHMLIPLNERSEFDCAALHPISGEQLAPSQSLWFSGYQALEPFVGTWIPVPFLRFLGRGYEGELRFDSGSSNWVRLNIERPANGLRAAEELTAVLAIDANIDASIRIEQDDYLAPNIDDVVFAPIFKLVTEAANLSEFLSDAWLDAWLSRRYDAHVASQSTPVGKARSQPRQARRDTLRIGTFRPIHFDAQSARCVEEYSTAPVHRRALCPLAHVHRRARWRATGPKPSRISLLPTLQRRAAGPPAKPIPI